MSMTERVARAICEVDGECWEKLDQWTPRNDEGMTAYYIRCARAAIAAMREPSEAQSPAEKNLWECQYQADEDGTLVSVSRQALDEVLSEINLLRAENFNLAAGACRYHSGDQYGHEYCLLIKKGIAE